MYERLAICNLPVDDLLLELYERETLDPIIQSMNLRYGKWPIERYISLKLVTHPKMRDVTRKYISKLLEDREQYGYLYYLSQQNLLIHLNVRFQGEALFMESEDRDQIIKSIQELASEFACKGSMMHEITMIEIYYFFIQLVNRKLSWLAIEYMMNSVPQCTHLLMSPERRFPFVEKEPTVGINKNKLLFCQE